MPLKIQINYFDVQVVKNASFVKFQLQWSVAHLKHVEVWLISYSIPPAKLKLLIFKIDKSLEWPQVYNFKYCSGLKNK